MLFWVRAKEDQAGFLFSGQRSNGVSRPVMYFLQNMQRQQVVTTLNARCIREVTEKLEEGVFVTLEK